MKISKQYNSVLVKDNCALFASIFGFVLSDSVIYISPLTTPVVKATNFGTDRPCPPRVRRREVSVLARRES